MNHTKSRDIQSESLGWSQELEDGLRGVVLTQRSREDQALKALLCLCSLKGAHHRGVWACIISALQGTAI